MADEKSTGKRTLGVVEGRDSISEEARAAEAEASINEQIEVLKTEISRLKESAGLIAEGTGQLAVAKAESLREDLRQTIQANPLATLAGAAFIGYLFGLRHRYGDAPCAPEKARQSRAFSYLQNQLWRRGGSLSREPSR